MTHRPTTTRTRWATALAGAVLLPGLLAGCDALGGGGGSTGSQGAGQEAPSLREKAEMAAWLGGASPELTSLGTSVSGLATAAQGGDLAAVEDRLDAIDADVEALRKDPAPDPRIDDPLQQLLTTVSEGSSKVRQGVEAKDLTTAQEGAQSFADAQADLDALLKAARDYAGA